MNDKWHGMKGTAEIIRQRIIENLEVEELIIEDVSYQHAGHNPAAQKGETHFALKIVANEFKGLSRVRRHKLIYAMLEDLMKKNIHALQLDLKAPGE